MAVLEKIMNPDVVHKPDAQEGQPIPATRKRCCLSFLVTKHKSFSAGGKGGQRQKDLSSLATRQEEWGALVSNESSWLSEDHAKRSVGAGWGFGSEVRVLT